MELNQLLQFKIAAELEHFTKASHELYIAQSALSKTIKALETELEVPLFHREKRSIRLNDNGRILYKYTAQIVQDLEELDTLIGKNRRRENDTLSILLRTPVAFISQLLSGYRDIHPELRVQVFVPGQGISEDPRLYDLVIDSRPDENHSHMTSCLMMREPFVLAAPRSHPLANREHVDLSEARDHGFISYPDHTAAHRELCENCAQAGFTPRIAMISNDYFTVGLLVEAGVGLALAPKFSWGYRENERMALIPIQRPICVHDLYLLWDPITKPLCLGFRDYLLQWSSRSVSGVFSAGED